ncbi:hypothetical protein BKA67DRAFT_663702 [Truncatella angustata]|uniref:NACHT domain-containing protein n=1 Tax=Truncatella angustata TaxID=152316 RepID=A0A9P8RM91_9PEZI|nr:uncharacterized protein BKA67DRAFT_663702 [Truncatella angustata]KAH6645820.1 hypothetical protein BKA67DRAFT_663702 [Truncatella angustata]
MDPVSAVGIAAASVQLFGVAYKTFALCRKLRDGQASVKNHNDELQAFACEIKDYQRSLKTGHTRSAPRHLTELANKCAALSDELIKLLEYVSGGSDNASAASRILRSLKEQRKIEKLEISLKEKEKTLHSLLVQDIWRGLDFQAAERSKTFGALDTNVQKIISALAKQESTTASSTTILKRNLALLQHGVNKRLDKAENTTGRQLRALKYQAKEQLKESRSARRQEELFRGLEFSEMYERQGAIQGAAPKTLDWIFESDKVMPSSSNKNHAYRRQAVWDDLGNWLRHKDGIYWVSGKLGSGKSTLMAHLVNDQRTKNALKEWHQECHILASFFWRPGSRLQKSIDGLLRALLLELCRIQSDSAFLDTFLRQLPDNLCWNERTLTNAFLLALKLSRPVRFCIFIDGLDEYVGDYDQLLNLIFDLEEFENVKLCVSSRPEVQLTHRLSHCDSLRLQDLNESDIDAFVGQKLSHVQLNLDSLGLGRIQHQIVGQAEGVFLWAVLVTQAIVRGALAADDTETLLKRIERTPQPMNDLFKSMVGNIDEAHRESLALYLKFMEINLLGRYHLSVAVITAAKINGPIESMNRFKELCQQVETQIVAQSAGLLEIRQLSVSLEQSEADRVVSNDGYYIRSDTSDQRWPQKQQTTYTRLKKRCTSFPYLEVLGFELKRMSWVHRSAHDFMSDPATVEELGLRPITSEEAARALLAGGLEYLLAAPSLKIGCRLFRDDLFEHGLFRHDLLGIDLTTDSRLQSVLVVSGELHHKFPALAMAAINQLSWAGDQVINGEVEFPLVCLDNFVWLREEHWQKYRTGSSWSMFMFLAACMDCNCSFYISERIHLIPRETYGALILAAMNTYMVDSVSYLVTVELLHAFRSYIRGFFLGPDLELKCLDNNLSPAYIGSSISILAPRKKDAAPPFNLMHAINFAFAFIQFWQDDLGRRFIEKFSVYKRKILVLIYKIAHLTDLYLEVANGGPKLRLHLSALSFHTCAWKSKGLSIPEMQNRYLSKGLRIICLPWATRTHPMQSVKDIWEETTRIVVVVLRQPVLVYLIRHLELAGKHASRSDNASIYDDSDAYLPHMESCLRISDLDIEKVCQSIEEDILANEQGLNATEQIFALACIRKYLPRLLKSIQVPTASTFVKNLETSYLYEDGIVSDESAIVSSHIGDYAAEDVGDEASESDWITEEEDYDSSGD